MIMQVETPERRKNETIRDDEFMVVNENRKLVYLDAGGKPISNIKLTNNCESVIVFLVAVEEWTNSESLERVLISYNRDIDGILEAKAFMVGQQYKRVEVRLTRAARNKLVERYDLMVNYRGRKYLAVDRVESKIIKVILGSGKLVGLKTIKRIQEALGVEGNLYLGVNNRKELNIDEKITRVDRIKAGEKIVARVVIFIDKMQIKL